MSRADMRTNTGFIAIAGGYRADSALSTPKAVFLQAGPTQPQTDHSADRHQGELALRASATAREWRLCAPAVPELGSWILRHSDTVALGSNYDPVHCNSERCSGLLRASPHRVRSPRLGHSLPPNRFCLAAPVDRPVVGWLTGHGLAPRPAFMVNTLKEGRCEAWPNQRLAQVA